MSIIARRSAIIGSAIASIMSAQGATATPSRSPADLHKEVDALRAVLDSRRLVTIDELQRGIEAIPVADCHGLSHSARSIRSITENLMAKGLITEAELRATLDRL